MLVFRFLRNLPTTPFSFQVYSFVTLLFLQFLRQLSGCLFVAMKFPVTFAIFADFFRFLQAISIKHIFAKIATKICEQSFYTVCNSLLILLFLPYFPFFLFISDSSFNFSFAKIAKTICYQIFATVFNPGHKRRAKRQPLRNSFNHFNETNSTIYSWGNEAPVECFGETGLSYSLAYPESEDPHLRCPTLGLTGLRKCWRQFTILLINFAA